LDRDGMMYSNVESFTLLGVDITSDHRNGVRFDVFIHRSIKKAYNSIWILKRLTELGISNSDLLLVYKSRVRCHLENCVPLWCFSITKYLSKLLERVQSTCLYIILGKRATISYTKNLELVNMQTLEERRVKLCKRFALKTARHSTHGQLFKSTEGAKTRHKNRFVNPRTKSSRYKNSSIPSLTKLLNNI
jgi:hypothetical protein